MKKLMAMIGAVAMSFGLFAATTQSYTISFEQAESEKGVDTSTMLFTPVVSAAEWAWTGDPLPITAYGTETKFAYGEGAFARRSGFDAAGDNFNYLPLETGTDELVRSMNGNIYLDQLVKFTGFEDPQTNLVSGTKIAIWMSEFENEDETTTTNLYVTVGKVDAVGGVEQIALEIDPIAGSDGYELNTWYRLSIKSLGNVFTSDQVAPHAGFLVYVNGQQVGSSDPDAKLLIAADDQMDGIAKGYMAEGQLFTAINAEDATFTQVGYQGIGAIDDVIIDAEGPKFCQTVDVVIPTVEGAEVDYVDVNGTQMQPPVSVPDGTTITVYFKAAEGMKLTGDTSVTQTITSDDYTIDVDDIVAEEVVATLTPAEGDAEELAESELAAALAALDEGDVIETVAACGIYGEEEAVIYSFTPNTTITGTEDGLSIYVGNYVDEETTPGYLVVNDAVTAMAVSFEDGGSGTFEFGGTVAGTLEVPNGLAMIAAEIELAEGATIKAANLDLTSYGTTISIDATSKVMETTGALTEEQILVPDEYELNVSDEDAEGYYTYTAQAVGLIDLEITAPENTTVTLVEGDTVEGNAEDGWKAEEGDDLEITLTADEGFYFDENGATTKKVEATAAAEIDLSETPGLFEAAVKVVAEIGTKYYASADTALAAVEVYTEAYPEDTVTATFLKAAAKENEYAFDEGVTIEITTDAAKVDPGEPLTSYWEIADGNVTFLTGLENNKCVTFADAYTLTFAGEMKDGSSIEAANLAVPNGKKITLDAGAEISTLETSDIADSIDVPAGFKLFADKPADFIVYTAQPFYLTVTADEETTGYLKGELTQALAKVQQLEAAKTFPIVITPLDETEGLTFENDDRAFAIDFGTTITIPNAGHWIFNGELMYNGAIDGAVTATDIKKFNLEGAEAITLMKDAVVTVGKTSTITKDFFTCGVEGSEVTLTETGDLKIFMVEAIPYVATVQANGGAVQSFLTSAAALAAVQALEADEANFPIVAKALVADLAVVGPNGVTIVLAKDETITISANSWVFSGGATISDGPIALAAGATFTVVGQIANYKTLFSAPTDYEVVEIDNKDGTFTYSAAQSAAKVAEIVGGDQYATLQAAIEAAQDGDVIKLLSDYTAADTESIIFNDDVTFDLNGKTLTLSNAQRDGKKFAMGAEEQGGPDVTITNGVIHYVSGGCGRGFNVFGGTLTVACTFEQTAGSSQPVFDIYSTATVNIEPTAVIDAQGGDVFRTKGDLNTACYVNINGGSITCPANGVFNTAKPLPLTVTLNGGEISYAGGDLIHSGSGYDAQFICNLDDTCGAKFDTDTAKSAGCGLKNLVAKGYEAVQGEDEWYTIAKIPSFDVTFSVDEVEIPDSTTNVLRDTVLTVDMIPDVSSLEGAWDVDPVGAIITETTNFNFTTVKYVTITLPQELPDGVTGLVVSQSVDGVEWELVEGNQIVKDNQYVVVATGAEGYTIANPIKSGTADDDIEVTDTDFEGKITPPAADVAQIGGTKFKTLADAVAAAALAGESVKIELLADVTEDVAISGVTGELDLGEFTLTGTISVTDSTLEISNGTIDYGTGTFTVNSGTVTLAEDATMTGAGSAEPINIKGGTFNIYGTIDDRHTGDSFVIVLKSGTTVNAYEGCSITGGSSVFKPKCEPGKAYLNIYGGTFTVNHPSDKNIYGVFYGTKDGDTTEITIAGGTFVVNGGGKCMFYDCSDMIILDADSEAGLDDTCTATFNIDPLGGVTEVTEEKLCKTGYVVEQSEEDGLWRIVKYVPPVAKIGTVEYKSLGAAIAAANESEGETIELLANYTAADAENLVFTKNATLDLGEFELTLSAALLNAQLFKVVDGAEVSFENGTVTMGDSAYGLQVYGTATLACTMTKLVNTKQGPICDIYAQGTTSANGGIVNVVDGANLNSARDVFRHKKNGAGVAAKASIFVSGGTMNSDASTGIFFGSSYASADDVVTITGGTFNGNFGSDTLWGKNGSIKFGAEAADARFQDKTTVTKYLADGFELVEAEEDGYWKIAKIPSFTVAAISVENATVEATNKTAKTVLALPATVLRDTEIAVTVTPNDDYEYATTPAGWTKNDNGSITTNATVTADLAITVEAPTAAAAPWPVDPDFPADADDDVKGKYADWAKTYGVTDPAGTSDAFLMNDDPKAGTATALAITSIEVADGVATIKVAAGEKNLQNGINGKLFVSATDDLAGEWVTTQVETPDSFENEGKTAVFTVQGAQFMKAKVDFKVEEVEKQ